MAEENGVAENDAAAPAGPFLREYAPTAPFRHTSARTTSVLFYRNGGYSVAGVSGVRHVDKRALARPHTICEIATGTFVTTLQMELPAAGGATFFKAEVDIRWTVEDPYLVAVQVVTDIAQQLTSPTLERLRQISARFPVDRAEEANAAITERCVSGQWNDLGDDIGLRVRLFVRLRVDDTTIDHAGRVRGQRGAAELARMRQEEYLRVLRSGELGLLSHMLAADPAAANSFLEKIRQEGRQDEKDRIDRLFDMNARGEIASSEIEGLVLGHLAKEHRSIHGVVGGAPRALEPVREEPFTPEWVAAERPSRPQDGGGRGGWDDRDERDGRGGWGDRGDRDDRNAGYRGTGHRDADRRDVDERRSDRRDADRRDSGHRVPDGPRDEPRPRYADDVWADAPDDVRGGDVRDVRDAQHDPPAPRGRTRARDDGWGWAADE
ncbi:hypothetical protein ACPCB7_32005 [Streptomyces arboris]|uniref:hypothetical protein n=1 Tax=Streptomyces arboris TaxID=2600619 RepID=UPI003C2EC4FC